MDDVSVFNRALSATEIAALWKDGPVHQFRLRAAGATDHHHPRGEPDGHRGE